MPNIGIDKDAENRASHPKMLATNPVTQRSLFLPTYLPCDYNVTTEMTFK
jgi:hypothetical protein